MGSEMCIRDRVYSGEAVKTIGVIDNILKIYLDLEPLYFPREGALGNFLIYNFWTLRSVLVYDFWTPPPINFVHDHFFFKFAN